MAEISAGLDMMATGIPGFDLIAAGGMPRGRVTLVSGTAGTAKTILAVQFLVEGIRKEQESGVLVTLEETPDDLRASMRSLGWDLAAFEAAGKLVFVDGSSLVGESEALVGDYDLGGLLARIQAAIARVGAKRLALDAVTALFARFPDAVRVRSELFRICRAIRGMGVTAVITSERATDDAEISRYGVEEFVADNVIILRNVLDAELRRRTLEILKMRGVPHRRGEYPLVIVPGRGIEIVPLSAIPLQHPSSSRRATSGNAALDEMLGGGLYCDSMTLVSGQTGVGKTLMAVEFVAGGVAAGERCLFLGFEESREQLFRNARAWGRDLERLESEGGLRLVCEYPESASLEDRLVRIKDLVGEFRPQRLVLDTLSGLNRVASDKTFRDFLLGLTMLVKRDQITALMTAEIGPLLGAVKVTDQHWSAMIDTIVLLRYVEIGSRMYRSLTVLKTRGSHHDPVIREYWIDDSGLQIGAPFAEIEGVLTGAGELDTPRRSPVPACRGASRRNESDAGR